MSCRLFLARGPKIVHQKSGLWEDSKELNILKVSSLVGLVAGKMARFILNLKRNMDVKKIADRT